MRNQTETMDTNTHATSPKQQRLHTSRLGKIVERAESNFMNNDSNDIVLLDKMIHMSNVQVLAPAPVMTISDYKSSIELLQHENNQLKMKNKKLLELMNRNQKL